jgi:nucleoid DNA-binding protein
MNHSKFIKALQKALIEEGIRISQDKLKKIFEVMADVILETIEEEEKILIHQFLCFKLVDVKPRQLPDKTFSQPSLSMKVSLSEKYKKMVKDKLNN